jgi:predicted metal-dependent hydrolase
MLFDSPRARRTPRLASGDLVEVDGRPVRLRVEARARRVSLRLDSARREVIATAPSPRRLADALAFAETKAAWIAERLDALPAGRPFAPGTVLLVGGRPCRLERAAMRIPARLIPEREDEPARLLASGEGAAYARAVERVLRREALQRLTERTAHHAAALGAPAPPVSVMDARSRWGSCTPAGPAGPARIRYVWRLVLAPPAVADYVAAHECAHLLEANHGPRFWALVRRLYGDPARARAWLREHGAALHAIGRG